MMFLQKTQAYDYGMKSIEHIYDEWDKALSLNDVDALEKLYARDAVPGSPLMPHLLKKERGICEGREQIHELLNIIADANLLNASITEVIFLQMAKEKVYVGILTVSTGWQSNGFCRSNGIKR